LDLFRTLGRLGRDIDDRKLVCTPFNGEYGLAGWVVCVEGSPPRGTLVIPKDWQQVPFRPFYIDCEFWRSQRLTGEEQLKTIQHFCASHLAGASEAFDIRMLNEAETRELEAAQERAG
jgi:hypothetical protein